MWSKSSAKGITRRVLHGKTAQERLGRNTRDRGVGAPDRKAPTVERVKMRRNGTAGSDLRGTSVSVGLGAAQESLVTVNPKMIASWVNYLQRLSFHSVFVFPGTKGR